MEEIELEEALVGTIHGENDRSKKGTTSWVDLWNLKIELIRCTFKVLITILQLDDTPKAYSMLLKRPWLKQIKVHHD